MKEKVVVLDLDEISEVSYENIVVSKSCSEKVVVLDLDEILEVRYENFVVERQVHVRVKKIG
jgi:hypothetical protein